MFPCCLCLLFCGCICMGHAGGCVMSSRCCHAGDGGFLLLALLSVCCANAGFDESVPDYVSWM
jgi:hypothetical protein